MIRDCEEVVVQQFIDPYDYQERIGFLPIEAVQGYAGIVGDSIRARQEYFTARAQAENLEARVTELEVKVSLLLRVLNASGGGETDVPVDNSAGEQPAVTPPEADPPVAPEAPVVDVPRPQLASTFWELMRSKCAACHSGPTAKAGFVLFELDGSTPATFGAAKAVLVDYMTYSNQMPPKPKPELTADEYNLVREFVQTYSDEIRELADAALQK